MSKMKAQKNYYRLASARSSVRARIDAIRERMDPASTVVDIGCNDGTILGALLDSGHAARAFGVDLEDIRPPALREDPRMDFLAWNANELEVGQLPPADYLLILNILHHMVSANTAKACQLTYSLGKYPVIFTDMGSMTERGGFGWKKNLSRYWKDDDAVMDAIFPSTWERQIILTYGAQGGGRRRLWKITT